MLNYFIDFILVVIQNYSLKKDEVNGIKMIKIWRHKILVSRAFFRYYFNHIISMTIKIKTIFNADN